jgi:hypothetical protein
MVHSNAQLDASKPRVSASCRIYIQPRLVATAGVCCPLLHDHGLQVLTLVHLHLDLLDDVGQVRSVLYALAVLPPGSVVLLTSSALVHSSLGRSW